MQQKWTVALIYPQQYGSDLWPRDLFVGQALAESREDAIAQVRAQASAANRGEPKDADDGEIAPAAFLPLLAVKGWIEVELLY